MATLANIQVAYKQALQDRDNQLEGINDPATNAVRDASIEAAIRWYSRRYPNVITALVSSVAGGYYSPPTGFTATSRITSLEYPIDQSPPAYLSPKSYRIVRRETSLKIYVDINPSSAFRLTFTGKHDETAPTTIPDEHTAIVGRMAAVVSAMHFAARYANSVQNNLDGVNYRSKEQEWRSVHDDLLKQINNELRRDEIALLTTSDVDAVFRGWRT